MKGIVLAKGSVLGHRVMWTDYVIGKNREPCMLGWNPVTPRVPNTILFDAATIYANLLATGDRAWRIAMMYLEYANVGSPGDTVSPPVFTRGPGAGVDYYESLTGSPNRDYLRVPIISAFIDSSNEIDFPQGNRVTFFAQSAGTTGVNGKAFSDVANSLVFGGALVASPDPDDPTEDVVLARFYYSAPNQIPKLATGQIGIEWTWTGG
jgi:hypothetical protein